MTLADEYRRQFAWRDMRKILGALPLAPGQTVLDLGCGVGDFAAELVARGTRVIGYDANEHLLDAARSRGLPNAEFVTGDLRALPDMAIAADGVWCSFVAAYFTDLAPVIAAWGNLLRAGGWIAITEINDLLGHGPVEGRTKELLDAYAADAFAAGRYDMHMGRKLRGHLERAGYSVVSEVTVPDLELSFDGPARPDVLEGWKDRFERMPLLQTFCGDEFERVGDDFLWALAWPDHRSGAVRVAIATK